MTDPASLLNVPLGEAGSGRVRYGAAMALYQSGKISAEVLEVYRIASAHDARDPIADLQEQGLPVSKQPLYDLYSAARDYLLALDHPGAAEVRAGLPKDPGLMDRRPPRANPVADRWLEPALAATDQPVLAKAIRAAAGMLDWVTYDAYPRDQIGEAFATNHAFASIRGEASPYAARDFDLGLFLIAPDVLYRDHHHAAPELYAPLTGPHGWRFGPGTSLIVKPAHAPVWNPPYQPHLTKVGRVPFLCLFVWTRDVNEPARVLAADDWPSLEGSSLD
jgi:Dimethlysulfonioproprionate lyase